MSHDVFLHVVVLFVGLTSLYFLLGLFQRRLPTQAASEARKLSNVGQLPSVHMCRGSAEGPQLAPPSNDVGLQRTHRSHTSLAKTLRYGAWAISPLMFHLSSIVLSLAIAIMVATVADRFILPISLLAGPLIMRLALRRSVERRTKRFSDDYPQFLMTVVSLLKTGMTPSGALEEAARGLEPESLVRTEVLLMIERVRVGISEEKSIGGFAETIEHPEIELFVQSLLLGLRVGGSLADSLERLSKQVRKRQHFRSSAIASVTQQRGSMIAIAIIMGGLAAFVSLTMPDMVRGLCTNPTGWVVVQVCVVTVIVAVVWFRSITRIKV